MPSEGVEEALDDRRRSMTAARAMRATPTMQPMTMPAIAPPLSPDLLEDDSPSAAWVAASMLVRVVLLLGDSAEGRTVLASPVDRADGEVAVAKSSTVREPVTSSSIWGAICNYTPIAD